MAKGKSTVQAVVDKTKEVIVDYAKVSASVRSAELPRLNAAGPASGQHRASRTAPAPSITRLPAAARHPLRLHSRRDRGGPAGHQAAAQHLAAADALRLSSSAALAARGKTWCVHDRRIKTLDGEIKAEL